MQKADPGSPQPGREWRGGQSKCSRKEKPGSRPLTPTLQGGGGPGAGVSAACKPAFWVGSCLGLLQPPSHLPEQFQEGPLLGQAKTVLPQIAPTAHRLRHRARAFFRQAAPPSPQARSDTPSSLGLKNPSAFRGATHDPHLAQTFLRVLATHRHYLQAPGYRRDSRGPDLPDML